MRRYVMAADRSGRIRLCGLATSGAASAAPDCPNNTVVVQGEVVSPTRWSSV